MLQHIVQGHTFRPMPRSGGCFHIRCEVLSEMVMTVVRQGALKKAAPLVATCCAGTHIYIFDHHDSQSACKALTAQCCMDGSAHRSRSTPGGTTPAAGSSWQNTRSSTLTAIALPIMPPTIRSLTPSMSKFNRVGLMANRRSISERVMRLPRVVTQCPEALALDFVKQGLRFTM